MRVQLTRRDRARMSLATLALATAAAMPAGADERSSAPVEVLRPRDLAADVAPRRLSISASTELAGYADTDHVTVASPGVSGTVSDEIEGWSVSGRYLLDAVTAASVDIVSTASSRWTERRHVGSGTASVQRGALGVTASGGVSSEPDYLSFGGGVSAKIDLLDKNVTPFAGLSYGHDDVGRTGLARSRWALMQTGGIQAGVTFIVNPSTIASVQLDGQTERGYLAKPYRHVALFAPGGAAQIPAGASIDQINAVRRDERPLESLPDHRERLALTGRIAHRRGRASLHADQRFYTDDWGMWASTTELRPMIDVGSRLVIWPHLRLHTQTAVSFWQRAYEVGIAPDGQVALPVYRAGDRELSWLTTVTIGGGFKQRLTSDRRSSWYLSFQVDAARTNYPDTLYISHRWSLFSAFALGADWN